ncbi:MAG: hypothetical protein F6J96_07200 [Symploca sp. SIO1C2]|nr:hypothetical protein [Symploca sp. SIO1C2]
MVQQLQPTAVDSDWLYPESDGKPLSDNTVQFRLITTIQGGIDALFADDPNIFVAGDLLWYPVEAVESVEGVAKSQAPDVMVVFGRPKGDRRSYKQFQEDGIAPQVVFEILSKSNTEAEMLSKFKFYERYGVEEYYLYDPALNLLKGWLQQNQQLIAIDNMEGWISPRLGCRFETARGALEVYRPDGQRMTTYVETSKRAEQESQRAEQEAQRAQQEYQARRDAIPRLLALGLSVEQVAAALNLSIEEINQDL